MTTNPPPAAPDLTLSELQALAALAPGPGTLPARLVKPDPASVPQRERVPPLVEYLHALELELVELPYVFQPMHSTHLCAGCTVAISLQPQRSGCARGVLFDPMIAGKIVLTDFRVGNESALVSAGEIPGALLTVARFPAPADLLPIEWDAMARFNPMRFQIGNSIVIHVRALEECDISGAFVFNADDYQARDTVHRLHAKLERFEAQQAADVRQIAALVCAVEQLQQKLAERPTEPAPAPAEPAPSPTTADDEQGWHAWATPCDES